MNRNTALIGAVMLVVCLAARLANSADSPSTSTSTTEPTASTSQPATPPEWPVRTRPPSFEYEQCANECQMRRDQVLTACLVPDNPNKPSYSGLADCSDGGRKQFLACIAVCPADVGASP